VGGSFVCDHLRNNGAISEATASDT
jgi:hypothetical protein